MGQVPPPLPKYFQKSLLLLFLLIIGAGTRCTGLCRSFAYFPWDPSLLTASSPSPVPFTLCFSLACSDSSSDLYPELLTCSSSADNPLPLLRAWLVLYLLQVFPQHLRLSSYLPLSVHPVCQCLLFITLLYWVCVYSSYCHLTQHMFHLPYCLLPVSPQGHGNS